MLSSKRAFFAGLLLAPILCLSLLGGLGTAQAVSYSQTDSLANYLQPNAMSQVKPTLPTVAPICQYRAMGVIAHEDDDLLFMNPDLQSGLSRGDCVQTVYVTAGDAGMGPGYWAQREHGAEAAYSIMLNLPNDWQEKQVKLDNRWLVNVASLRQAPNVTLIFIRLPDGNMTGEGFASTNFESLQKLEADQIDKIQTVDGQAAYSLEDLTALLAYLINQYRPDKVRTQANDYPDHSDHVAVSRLASQIYQQYLGPNLASISFYNGYPIGSMATNVSVDNLAQKETAFMEYAKYDNAVCSSLDECYSASTYGLYFTRQYRSP